MSRNATVSATREIELSWTQLARIEPRLLAIEAFALRQRHRDILDLERCWVAIKQQLDPVVSRAAARLATESWRVWHVAADHLRRLIEDRQVRAGRRRFGRG